MSIYDCPVKDCEGKAERTTVTGMEYIRKCIKCGAFGVYSDTKRGADNNWKNKEIRQPKYLNSVKVR